VKVALAHDWLTGLRGGERVLHQLALAHPGADLYTLFHQPGATTPAIDALRIHTSPLDRLPGMAAHYRKALPLFPLAMERFRPAPADLMLSVSHAVAKNIPAPPGTPHLCYCLTPMRYVWDQADAYRGRGAFRLLSSPLAAWLRSRDARASGVDRVTRFVAISAAVAERIRRSYGRTAPVVHPPVEVERITPSYEEPDDFYLLVGGFVPYKRDALAIEAFADSGRRLVVAGDGPMRASLAQRFGDRVDFLGRISDAELAELYARCRALIYPQEEDFGIVAVEAQAAGRPVIAFGRGGALDTVRPLLRLGAGGEHEFFDESTPTGVHFLDPTVAGLREAVALFEANESRFDAKQIRGHAEHFRAERFLHELNEQIEAVCQDERR
jgi:glycosyltransferase involved in cell wall biosynthesis